MRDLFQQRTVGCMLAGGCLMIVCGGVLSVLFTFAGVFRGTYTRDPGTNAITDAGDMNLVPLMIVMIAAGALLMFIGLGYGVMVIRGEKKGPRTVVEHFQVLARYAYDGQEMLNEPWQIESAEKPRFYVRGGRMHSPVTEYECSEAVYWSAGEGMVGEAETQGKWLGRFTPYVGDAPG
jgi:hypothetical protein